MILNTPTSARLMLWGARQLLRFGWPRRIVDTYVGLGDELMAAAALRDFHAESNARGTWFLTRYPALHDNSQLPVTYLPWDARYFRLGTRLKSRLLHLHYSRRDELAGVDRPLPGRYIENLARQLGVCGPVTVKPHLRLRREEIESARAYIGCVVVQSSAQGASIPIPTKQWPVDRMQLVVDMLQKKTGAHIVQVGTANDPPLDHVADLRGRTSIRATAAVLANARLFIGLAGGLMHLARAVDCRAVVIYGGRESPAVSAYSANINLINTPPCSPCYLIDACPYDLICLHAISVADVVAAAEKQLSAEGTALPTDIVAA